VLHDAASPAAPKAIIVRRVAAFSLLALSLVFQLYNLVSLAIQHAQFSTGEVHA
jgi:hypothetical protein